MRYLTYPGEEGTRWTGATPLLLPEIDIIDRAVGRTSGTGPSDILQGLARSGRPRYPAGRELPKLARSVRFGLDSIEVDRILPRLPARGIPVGSRGIWTSRGLAERSRGYVSTSLKL